MPRQWTSAIRVIIGALIVFSVFTSFWLSHSYGRSYCYGNAFINSINLCHGDAPSVLLHDKSPFHPPHRTEQGSNPQEIAGSRPSEGRRVQVLLGISSLIDSFGERQRRHLIRNTYLDFDRLHRPDQPNRVCSLRDYLSRPNQLHSCQLIYTFILGPANGVVSNMERGAELPGSMFEDHDHELDVIYVNVNETDLVGKRWSWLRFASSQIDHGMDIPLVAYTDAHVLLKPATFWETNPLFSMSSSMLKGIYAGLSTSKSDCPKSKCASLARETVMRRFVLLSSDLVKYLANQPIPPAESLTAEDSPDVAIANGLQYYPNPIQEMELQGLVAKVSLHGTVGDFLDRFDQYKDGLVDYQDPDEIALVQASHSNWNYSSSDRPPRFLFGIFSMDNQLELERREMIRNTYLQAFMDTDSPHRICSLWDLDRIDQQEECQIAYVFVVSGNPNGPKELVDVSDITGPIALDGESVPTAIRLADHDKGDIVYLNIQENGKEGKSQTYFKFATTLKHYFDYLVKTDSDTLVYPKSLLDYGLKNLPKFPHNVRIYGGDYRIKPSERTLNLGPAYMGGQFYFMSPDLARYITSSACNRTSLALFSEDQSIGNFVHSLPKPIRRVWVKTMYFDHPIKRVDRMKRLWNKRNSRNH